MLVKINLPSDIKALRKREPRHMQPPQACHAPCHFLRVHGITRMCPPNVLTDFIACGNIHGHQLLRKPQRLHRPIGCQLAGPVDQLLCPRPIQAQDIPLPLL